MRNSGRTAASPADFGACFSSFHGTILPSKRASQSREPSRRLLDDPMFRSTSYAVGLEITDLAACNFERLRRVTNDEVLVRAGRAPEEKLLRFLSDRMGIRN